MRGELSRLPSGGDAAPGADPGLLNAARALLAAPDVAASLAELRADDARTLRQQRELTEIPSPPFGEGARAERMVELLGEAGLVDVARDVEGNVVASFPGSGRGGGDALVVAAHLDTVFPAGTDVTVREDGDRLLGPGISDDGRGLAAVLALARALRAGSVALAHPLLVVATVGEEGAGDLRGVRYLSGEGALASGCAGFMSLDGAGLSRIVNAGLGSRRYRIRATGPGGHSWVDWGTPNPIHALGRAVAGLLEIRLPERPATTLSVGRWSGGTSINAIPREAWIEFEVRGEDGGELARVDALALERVRAAFADEDPGGEGGLRLEVEMMGDRPAGRTNEGALLVRAAAAATRALGAEPELAVSSTDANILMAAGVPAITLGAGGEAGLTHTPREWYRNVRGPDGIARALLTLLLADGRGGAAAGA